MGPAQQQGLLCLEMDWLSACSRWQRNNPVRAGKDPRVQGCITTYQQVKTQVQGLEVLHYHNPGQEASKRTVIRAMRQE